MFVVNKSPWYIRFNTKHNMKSRNIFLETKLFFVKHMVVNWKGMKRFNNNVSNTLVNVDVIEKVTSCLYKNTTLLIKGIISEP